MGYTVTERLPERGNIEIRRAARAVEYAIRMAKAELLEQDCSGKSAKDVLYGICAAAIEKE